MSFVTKIQFRLPKIWQYAENAIPLQRVKGRVIERADKRAVSRGVYW